MPIAVIIVQSGLSITLVESRRPPRPVSRTKTSNPADQSLCIEPVAKSPPPLTITNFLLFIKASPNKANVFGITQLKINGQKGCSSADWFENNQKIPLDIQEGTKEYFEVEYYLLITEDPESITIFTYKDNLELTFAKKKWLISSLERNFTTDYCDKAKFFEDLANNDTDGYIWFPSAEELEFGKTELAALEAPLF